MSKNADDTTLQQLTLLPADSLANLTVWPGSKEAQRMTATSGRNIAALLPNSGPLGYLLKMYLESEGLCSTRCYLTWKIWRTPQGRLLYRLAPSTPRIDESEFSLLPTPRAIYGEHPGMKNKSHLAGAARLWPTPNAFDATGITGNLKSRKQKGGCSNLKDVIGGQLNPTWVEWLMGFPIGWTDLEPSETP